MDNYEIVDISSQAAMNSKSERIFSENGVNVDSVLIPETHTTAKRVFFVSDNEGNEFDQFPMRQLALHVAVNLSKLNTNERAKLDK